MGLDMYLLKRKKEISIKNNPTSLIVKIGDTIKIINKVRMYTYIIKDFDFENNVINCSDTENKNIVLHINNLFSFDKVYINNISLNDFDYLLLKNNIKTHKIIVEKIRNEIEMWDNEVMYWRKFNAIHNWFVENVQNSIDDCGDYLVSKEKLTNLVNLINEILFPINCNICKEKEIIEKLLPPKSGFFFGSTDIDDYFIRNLKDTYTDLKEVLNTFDFKNYDLVYSSSW